MNTNTITCLHCNKQIPLSDALSHQIKEEITKKTKEEMEDELKRDKAYLLKRYEAAIEKERKRSLENIEHERQISKENERSQKEKMERLANELKEATKAKEAIELTAKEELLKKEKIIQQEAQTRLEIEIKNAKQELEKNVQTTALETERLKKDIEISKESEKSLRNEITKMIDELSRANKAKEDATLEARRELLEKEEIIRKEAVQKASENYHTKIREQEETIKKLHEQLTTAQQVATQGSQQLQGEILELDVERNLKASFPYDTITEVKKGERGSDIRQVVNEPFYQNCGLILWECKNAKTYQTSWLNKIKDEMATEKAQMAVIVFNPTSGDGADFEQLQDNVWMVKPRYVAMLCTLLRDTLIKVYITNRNNQGKDIKIELMYNYLTGVEFSNRMRFVVEAYKNLKDQLDTEKKQTLKRWATQEKTIEKAVISLSGMFGDLEGIAGKEIVSLPELADETQ